jgi:hypothetical protein
VSARTTPLVLSNRDPGDEQPALFNDPPRCTAKHCQAGDRKNLCGHDADIAAGIRDPYAPRPKGCINGYDPAAAEIPY